MVQGSASPGARECMVSSKYKGRGCPLLNKNQRPYAQINVDPRSHKKDHGSTAPEKRKKSFSRKGDVLRKQFLDNFADGIPARYLDGYVVDFIIYHQLLMPLSGGRPQHISQNGSFARHYSCGVGILLLTIRYLNIVPGAKRRPGFLAAPLPLIPHALVHTETIRYLGCNPSAAS